MKSLLRMVSYLRRYRQIALAAYFSLTLSSAVMLATPRLLQTPMDQAITAKDMPHIISLAAILVGIALVGATKTRKTTIANIITRFNDVQLGGIAIDDQMSFGYNPV